MLTTFLVILFTDLTFADISIQELMQWYNYHPFAFIIAVQDVILGSLILFRLFNEYINFEEDSCCLDEDTSDWQLSLNDLHDLEDLKK